MQKAVILPNHRHTIIPDFFTRYVELICPYNSISTAFNPRVQENLWILFHRPKCRIPFYERPAVIMAYLAPGEYCFKNESFQGPHFLYYSGHIYLVSKLIQTMAFSFDLNVHPFTIVPYCFQDFSVLTNYEIGEAFCSALSIISYKLLETFLRHTLPIRNKPITVFALYDFSIKHQSSKLVTLHCWSPKCSVQRYFYKSGNT